MDVGYGSFNKEAAGLEAAEGSFGTFIHHDGPQNHVLGLGQVTQKSERNVDWLCGLAGVRICGSKVLYIRVFEVHILHCLKPFHSTF